MNRIITYLTFNGNCKEAMVFYQQCLGGELSVQTIGESHRAESLPKEMRKYVLEAALTRGNMVIKGTDISDEPLARGNTITILLECTDKEAMKHYYKKLAEAGEETYPVMDNFFGGQCGMLKDRYGFQWLLRSGSKE